MKKMEFSITINALPEKVWEVIIGKDTYDLWTAAFAAGSTVKTDWKNGSKALFLDGKGNGMVSEIVESIPGKFLSIHHLGEVKNGVEDPTTYKGEEWGDALENYTLEPVNDNQTLWRVNMDMNDEYVDYMNKTWPLALQKVKELAEG
ncbi:uncharacterized protein YndB with AHSA1/START domain [Pedobacter cryoconitis]|uniref:Uncharacterized protein YndB with AHSA1/START domain n=1 Tax=Pedobacter cryoconitis TaxID=188932 RepID=A0A7W8YSI4_9SPHI|nr:SRPBCC domain-containing protein [Pedobacter cryoconitis]MBB5620937.1 uncharacterized protein YndB with AHSA1/START domain [Pedobacter cryoconitis]MBB5645832.1 uncharacterized protein YndB with AHSA1/START domain [Pedobacter cryoconitis]